MGDSPKESSLDKLTPGELVAELYKVEQAIGVGGMATVYAARDQSSGEHIALKILRSSANGDDDRGADARMRQRFFNELAMATRVRHPNIVEVLDFGLTDAGSLYIAMPRLFGMDGLRWMKRRGPVSAVEFIPRFCEVLDALELAHRDAIVHRDIKPANLFFARHDDERRIVLMDFGIAQRRDALFGQKRLSGSPRYMAPEYILEQETSPSVDVYQLGLTLVEFLLGARLMGESDMMACLQQHVNGEVPIPDAIHHSPLGPIIRQAIAYDPEERFCDAGQFCAALRALTDDDLLQIDRALNPRGAPRQSLAVGQAPHDSPPPDLSAPGSSSPLSPSGVVDDDTVVAVEAPHDDTVLDLSPPAGDEHTLVDATASVLKQGVEAGQTQTAQLLAVVRTPDAPPSATPATPQAPVMSQGGPTWKVWAAVVVTLLVVVLLLAASVIGF